MTQWSELSDTRWNGDAELWLDPLGDQAVRSACSARVGPSILEYTWQHEGQPQTGKLVLGEGGADFTDTFHSSSAMSCACVPGSRALVDVQGSYGPDADWGWRITVSLRAPTGELVLQMTNIAPWGEEVRAVRMVMSRK
jgi:hypothetical protein